MNLNNDHFAQQKQRLDEEMRALLYFRNPDTYSVITSVQRSLRQFHLEGYYEVSDILHEAYCRGIKSIQAGKTVERWLAWIRSTAFNIIRESSKKEQKSQSIDSNSPYLESILHMTQESLIEDREIDDNLKALQQSLKMINKGDAKLLKLQHLEGLSWREIAQRLVAEGGEAQSEQALRQRGCRAKKQLRQIFHTLKQTKQPSR
jgi:RNA polymerase sigma factor (sigma-70 family)